MPEYGSTDDVEDLSREEKVRFVLELMHRSLVHYGMWLAETRHQLGHEKGLDILHKAYEKSIFIQLKRLSGLFGFELKNGLPAAWLEMPEKRLNELMRSVAKNWLANDGVWFQAVEFEMGMNDAKRCNDTCWAHFSPFEAISIKRFLNFPENPGIDGIKKALKFRLYAQINRYSMIREAENSLVFQMNDCRVQSARKRKGLDDYPCKSAGIVEYPYFASTIDDRIKTECIGCPPDEHPEEWFCAWRFYIP